MDIQDRELAAQLLTKHLLIRLAEWAADVATDPFKINKPEVMPELRKAADRIEQAQREGWNMRPTA